jgi:Anti-sigma-K factor rskA
VSDELDALFFGEECRGEAAVYLLGLLNEQESRLFLEHARSCAVCSDDLAALAPAVDTLANTVPQLRAPGEIKRAVMDIVRSEASQQAARSSSAPDRATRRRSIALRRPVLALASAGLLAAGVAIGAIAVSSSGGGATRVVRADVAPEGTNVSLHQSGGHAWLTVTKLPPPSSGHVYELWVKRPGGALPRPTNSLFTPTASGAATVAVPDDPGTSEVMVTQEPAGGSRLPTSPPIIVARLA